MKNKEKGAKPILIFPGGMPHSLEYLRKCLSEGQTVIGASSINYDISRVNYPSWFYLPFITQPEFNDALRQAIQKFNIGGIYSPNPVVWDYLKRELDEISKNVELVNGPPIQEELSGYRIALMRAHTLLRKPLQLASGLAMKTSLPEIELAAIFRHSDVIPGQCDQEKICALCEVARFSAHGDIVEIGCLWGKSAFVLARLAQSYNIGNLLCIDPWSNEHLVQHDEKGLVDNVSAQIDAGEALLVFEMNLLPYSSNHINYLRMPSTDGAKYYLDHMSATTNSFGTTSYCGHIAILHIDGNHSYAAIKADIASWSGFVINGGWIIIDDYIWPYGDGPKRAADEFLYTNAIRIQVAFVMGGALFLQMAGQ